MKKILVLAVMMLALPIFATSCSAQRATWRNSQVIHLNELNHPATLKKFNKSTAQCQHDNITSVIVEAKEAYYKTSTIDELYELDAKMDAIWQFIHQAKRSHSQAEADLTVLQRKVRRSIAEAEGGVRYERDAVYRGNRGQDWGR